MEQPKCGHPKECWERDQYTDEVTCKWCEQVAALQSDNAALRKQLTKDAYVVNDGVLNVPRGSTIGYLQQNGGTVAIQEQLADMTRTIVVGGQ